MEIMDTLYWISDIAAAATAAVFMALSFYRAKKNNGNNLLFTLLTGFFICTFMCAFYYLLSWFLFDYPFVISPGDLSWVGAIAFLITAARVIKNYILQRDFHKLS